MNQGIAPLLPRMKKIVASASVKQTRPRVLMLYKKFLRHIPDIIIRFPTLPLTYNGLRDKIREEFLKNKDVKDVRAIDILIHKVGLTYIVEQYFRQGEMEYNDIIFVHAQGCHIMNYFQHTQVSRPKDFIGKFLSGPTSMI